MKYPPSPDGGITDVAERNVSRLELKYPPSPDGGITAERNVPGWN